MNTIRGITFAALISTASVACAQYAAYDLGPGSASAINGSGTIVGRTSVTYTGTGWTSHPLCWSGGVATDLGSLGGPSGAACAINSQGVVVGYSHVNDVFWHAFRYSNGTMSDLGVLNYTSAGYAINSAGTIVGESVLGDATRAFVYSDGTMNDLGSLGLIASCAQAINNAGAIVGWSNTPEGRDHAFSYVGGSWTDLGTLGGRYSTSSALDINDSGVIVGTSQTYDYGPNHAVIFQDGSITDLGTLGGANSGASAINSAGVIVGSSEVGSSVYHAFIYQDGRMMDLDPFLAGTGLAGESYAADINDNGDIVGTAYDINGVEHAFLLQPIPEPSCVLLTSLGVAALLLPRARRVRNPDSRLTAHASRFTSSFALAPPPSDAAHSAG